MEKNSKVPLPPSSTAPRKKPMTLLQAFGYSVAITALVVGCMALSDREKERKASPEFLAREARRTSEDAVAAAKKLQEAVLACAKDDIEAFVMSHGYVRASLKAPSTAKFPSVTDPGVRTTYLGNCTHEIRAFVDAQNAFGSTLRSRYTARMRKDPATNDWHLTQIQIVEP